MSPHRFECGYRTKRYDFPWFLGKLQCHRTLSSADTGLALEDLLLEGEASMSPHPFECGYRRVNVEVHHFAPASMSPHPFECGYAEWWSGGVATGSGFNVTAPFRVRIRPGQGRGMPAPCRFNVTAPFRVRIRLVARVGFGPRTCFNITAPFRVRIRTGTVRRGTAEKGFNVTAPFRVRIPRRRGSAAVRRGDASMSPHPFECGYADFASRVPTRCCNVFCQRRWASPV
jgi:hypothetical protein